MTEISGEDLVQTKDSDENETSGDKELPTTTKEKEKSTKESASEEKEAETSSGTDETDIKPVETSEKADAKPAQSQTSKPAVNEQQTKPVQKPGQAVTQSATKTPVETATTLAAAPVTKPAETQTTELQKPKVKTMWDAPYDVEGIKAYIINNLQNKGYKDMEKYLEKNPVKIVDQNGERYLTVSPIDGAWDNYCTTTAGPQRYYDKVNNCALGHQHYKWSEPFNGSIAENAEASTEWMVNHAINYWVDIYGSEYEYFGVYVETFDDGCVIFYILAM